MSAISNHSVKMITTESFEKKRRDVEDSPTNLLKNLSAPALTLPEVDLTVPDMFAQPPLPSCAADKKTPDGFSAETFKATNQESITPGRFSQPLPSINEDKKEIVPEKFAQSTLTAEDLKPQDLEKAKEIISSASNDRDVFAYYHTKRLFDKYELRRINRQMYVYIPEKGTYHSLDSNQLESLIRRGWDESTQIQLSAFAVKDIISRLCSDPDHEVTDQFFDHDENLVNFQNGTLNIATKTLQEHSMEFAQTNVLNAAYHPNLSLEGSLFGIFVKQICEDDLSKKDHLQELLGYMLSGFTKVKKAVVLDGVRNSGKSTLLRVIEQIIGPENVSHFSLADLGKRFVTGKLTEKKINICGERGAGMIKDIENFKMITGGDWCESENKGSDFISRPARTKLVFAGNSLPQFENEDDNIAFMERSTLFIFQNAIHPSDRIINMDDKLWKERDQIVSWAMEGLFRLVANNFTFSEASDADKVRHSRMVQVNPIEDFLEEKCSFQKGARVHAVNLYCAYHRYCQDNSLDSLSRREFTCAVISKTEGKGVIHKKLRIEKHKPLLGFENLCFKGEDESAEQTEQWNNS